MQSLENITVTEKLTYKVKLKGDCFKKDWDRWLEYNAKEARRLKKKGQDSRTDNIMLDIRKVAAEYLYMCARTSQPPRVWGPSSPHRLVVLGVGGWALRYVLAHSRWLLGLAPLARSGPFWVVEGPQVSGPGGSVRSGTASCHSPLWLLHCDPLSGAQLFPGGWPLRWSSLGSGGLLDVWALDHLHACFMSWGAGRWLPTPSVR